MNLQPIYDAIPHREPFLLIDEIVEEESDRIVCRKTFSGEEFWFQGHYPEAPVMPGVLLCEAVMQAGAILLSRRIEPASGQVPVATRADQVRFKRMVRPGDTVEIDVRLNEELSGAFYLTGQVRLGGKLATRLDFACTMATPEA